MDPSIPIVVLLESNGHSVVDEAHESLSMRVPIGVSNGVGGSYDAQSSVNCAHSFAHQTLFVVGVDSLGQAEDGEDM